MTDIEAANLTIKTLKFANKEFSIDNKRLSQLVEQLERLLVHYRVGSRPPGTLLDGIARNKRLLKGDRND